MASFYPNYYRYFRPPYSNFPPKTVPPDAKKTLPDDSKVSSNNQKSPNSYSFGPIQFKNPFFNDLDEPIFEVFGIQLYLDDIIILGLLFFLYQEEVQDEMLYIVLILLLL